MSIGQTRTILAVEDQSNWHKLLTQLLSPPKYELQIVETLQEAQKLILQTKFDAVLVNMNLIDDPAMPNDQLGFALLEFIQSKKPATPRIVITGEPSGRVLSTFVSLGVDEVLVKSKFNRSELIEAINDATNKKHTATNVNVTQQTRRINHNIPQFDVFLAHNSKDKALIKIICEKLKQQGLSPWLDEEQILAGRRVQKEIQQAILQVKTAVIFIGSHGLGQWQDLELETFVRLCVEADRPVIPVLLPGVTDIPDELPFLKGYRWVAFQDIEENDALEILVQGIKAAL
jgi:CheY-like chemotaxis protein